MRYSKRVMEPVLAQPPKLPEEQQPVTNPAVPEPIGLPANRGPVNPGQANSPDGPQVHNTDKHEGLRSILTTLAILVLAPLIAFALTAFIFQSYQVDGSSM